MGEYLVDIENLQVSFFTPAGEVKALNDVNITLKQGEVLGIVGESGSGKSVTAYTLMGLLPKTGRIVGGEVNLLGERVDLMKENQLQSIRGNVASIIFQDSLTSLNPVFTVGNQICESMLLHTGKNRKEAKERALELLNLVGINEPAKRFRQYPHELSGGMRQRIMIAIALACEPKLLIADEPTTALDVTIQAQILDLMNELKSKLNMGIILITHDLGVVSGICDNVAVMYGGRIVEYASASSIFYNPTHVYTKGLLNSMPKLTEAEHERLIPIEGTAPDMLFPPAGCPFAPRCEHAMRVCLSDVPPVTEVSDTHRSNCWLLNKEAL
ncbi:ABC transporter ATP-binding protein [Clostridia bacterium]|nr:ABC transporter ATP-binding protein [Clostridia bacterium]